MRLLKGLMRIIRRLLWLLTSLAVLGILITWACSLWVSQQTRPFVFTEVEAVPANRVGLLLGTSKYAIGGSINPFYQNRIDAATALFEAGKIEFIIASGDNRHPNYNEPRRMRNDLIDRGVPQDQIIPDTAGFRTLDSVIRSRKVFGQDTVTIISQKFHIERAIFIARHNGYAAIGFAATDVPRDYGYKTHLREYLARVKLMLDLYVFRTQPDFLGDEVPVGSGK